MRNLKNKKGITLIALVSTIIVLLILAGITINLTIGQGGILKRAEQVGENYINASEYERYELAQLTNTADNIIANITGGPIKEWSDTYTSTVKNNYTDKSGKTATIPSGFQVSLKAGETEIDTGLVIRNTNDLNEFVWIPCTIDGSNDIIKYDRYVFSRDSWKYTQYANGIDTGTNSTKIFRNDIGSAFYWIEKLPQDEKQSIEEYNGFYIGRYSTSIEDEKILIQKEKEVYILNITDGINKANSLYTKIKDNVQSKLVSSYAWDTALKFIEKNYSGFGSEEKTNYTDTRYTGNNVRNNICDMGTMSHRRMDIRNY